jgi:hypothetical protein
VVESQAATHGDVESKKYVLAFFEISPRAPPKISRHPCSTTPPSLLALIMTTVIGPQQIYSGELENFLKNSQNHVPPNARPSQLSC